MKNPQMLRCFFCLPCSRLWAAQRLTADNLIVPGQRIGPIIRQMPFEKVQALLGRPDRSISLPEDETTILVELLCR